MRLCSFPGRATHCSSLSCAVVLLYFKTGLYPHDGKAPVTPEDSIGLLLSRSEASTAALGAYIFLFNSLILASTGTYAALCPPLRVLLASATVLLVLCAATQPLLSVRSYEGLTLIKFGRELCRKVSRRPRLLRCKVKCIITAEMTSFYAKRRIVYRREGYIVPLTLAECFGLRGLLTLKGIEKLVPLELKVLNTSREQMKR
ncbi:hypothetical protein BHM03_00043404 [Ensete ventricosum]|nr:hypothetical protein BHM03_00043404 [Ensete ventricosum]